MGRVGMWLDGEEVKDGSAAYFFASEHERDGEANIFLNELATNPFFYPKEQRIRYKIHTSLDGKSDIGRVLQSVTCLAWHLNNMHATGVESTDVQQITSRVKVHYVYYEAGHIDKIFDDNAYLATNYVAVKKARHQERGSRKRAGLRQTHY
jgi:hypothetical protein